LVIPSSAPVPASCRNPTEPPMRRLLLCLTVLGTACDTDPPKAADEAPPARDTADDPTTGTTPPVDSDQPPDDTGDCECDDGLWCNGAETCDDEGNCIDGTPPTHITNTALTSQHLYSSINIRLDVQHTI